MEVVKTERKLIHVTDGVKVRSFNVTQLFPVAIWHRATDDELDQIFKYSDRAAASEQGHSTYLTEVLHPGDPMTKNSMVKAALRKEIEGLFEKGVFRIVKRCDVPANAVILPSRMVYDIKKVGTSDERHKARFAADGHMDRHKKLMIHSSPNIRHGTTREVVSTSAIRKWRICLKDAVQTFSQTNIMTRYVALEPAPELGLDPDVAAEGIEIPLCVV